jgi:hypothetical protein
VSVVTVETHSRWETTSLLRKLRGHNPYAIQLGHGHWVVRSSRASTAQALAEIEELVTEWALEEGAQPRVVHVADAVAVH